MPSPSCFFFVLKSSVHFNFEFDLVSLLVGCGGDDFHCRFEGSVHEFVFVFLSEDEIAGRPLEFGLVLFRLGERRFGGRERERGLRLIGRIFRLGDHRWYLYDSIIGSGQYRCYKEDHCECN